MNFYNTINAQSPQLDMFVFKVSAQTKRVLDLFTQNPDKWFTTREAHELYVSIYPPVEKKGKVYHEPHDSIKRAMTDLTEVWHLEKCSKDLMVMGDMGKPVYRWRLKK